MCSPWRRAKTPPTTNSARRRGNRAAPPPPPSRRRGRGAGRGARRAAKARLFLNFEPVASEPGKRRERTRGRPPPVTSFGEKVQEPAPRVPPPVSPPARAPSATTCLPRVLGLFRRLPLAPYFAANRLSGLARGPIGASRPVAGVTRESVPRSAGFGAAALLGAGGLCDHFCALPREECRPPLSPPLPSLRRPSVPERPRHEAQLHPATEGL